MNIKLVNTETDQVIEEENFSRESDGHRYMAITGKAYRAAGITGIKFVVK
jgi:hypothetical protein